MAGRSAASWTSSRDMWWWLATSVSVDWLPRQGITRVGLGNRSGRHERDVAPVRETRLTNSESLRICLFHWSFLPGWRVFDDQRVIDQSAYSWRHSAGVGISQIRHGSRQSSRQDATLRDHVACPASPDFPLLIPFFPFPPLEFQWNVFGPRLGRMRTSKLACGRIPIGRLVKSTHLYIYKQ